MSVLIKPIITEKATLGSELHNRYTFLVHPKANKVEIKKAVEDKIRNECRSCIYKVITKYNCDVLDIEKYLKFYQKDYFNDAKNYFDGVISDITYDITIKGKVVD